MTLVIGEPFADYLANPALGSGQAKKAYESLQLLADDLRGLTDRRDKTAYGFGRAFHTLILEPDKFNARYRIKPAGMKLSTREGKAWRDDEPGKEVINESDWDHMKYMQERMPAEIRAILERDGSAESVLRRDHRQARIDWMVDDDLYDLKTIEDINSAERDLYRYGYWLQQGWYELLFFQEYNRWPAFNFLFAEKKPPYRWQLWKLDPQWREYARTEAMRVAEDVETAFESGRWDDGEEDVCHIASMPGWLEGDW